MTSPCNTENHPLGDAAHFAQPAAIRSRSSRCTPTAIARSANEDAVTRSAHSEPHHARSSAVAKHHVLDDATTSRKPTSLARPSSQPPRFRPPPGPRRGSLVDPHPLAEPRALGSPHDPAVVAVTY